MLRNIACTLFLLAGLTCTAFAASVEEITAVVGNGIKCGKAIAAESSAYKPGEAEKYCKACACMQGYCEDAELAFHFLNGCKDGYKSHWGK